METRSEYTFANLNPSTIYTVCSCYGAHCSDHQEMTVRTTSGADALGTTKGIFWMAIAIAMAIFVNWF